MRADDLVKQNISYNENLNPAAWKGNKLKTEVRYKLLLTAQKFIGYLDIPDFRVLDIVLTGSMANYNWTKFSDFDLHVITDYEDLNADHIVEAFYRAKKEIWNDKHDVTIYGYDVELYVEDVKTPPESQGIYSILDNKWLKTPNYNPPSINGSAVAAKARDLMQLIDHAISHADDPDDLHHIKAKIRKMRQSGLEAHGEFGVENLAFKILRNTGYLKKLGDAYTKQQDAELSLSEADEPIRIKIGGDKGPNPAKEFVKAMYDEYPRNPINPKEFAVVFDDEHFAMFELDVNPGKKDVVYVKFMYSYPQRQGVGTKALKQLQDEAQQHGVDLELIAWDKGNVSKAALTRFYKKMGFQKDRGDMLRWKRASN